MIPCPEMSQREEDFPGSSPGFRNHLCWMWAVFSSVGREGFPPWRGVPQQSEAHCGHTKWFCGLQRKDHYPLMSWKSFPGSQAGMWDIGMCDHILVMSPTVLTGPGQGAALWLHEISPTLPESLIPTLLFPLLIPLSLPFSQLQISNCSCFVW